MSPKQMNILRLGESEIKKMEAENLRRLALINLGTLNEGEK